MDPSAQSAVRSMAALGLKRAPRAARKGCGQESLSPTRQPDDISYWGGTSESFTPEAATPNSTSGPALCRDCRAWVAIVAVRSVARSGPLGCGSSMPRSCPRSRAANTHLTTIMIAEKLADEIRREAKAGSVEHSALNSRPGANVCIWHFCDMARDANEGRFWPGSGHPCAGPSRARL